MNTWTSGGHFPQHRFGTGRFIIIRFCLSFSPSFRLGVNQNIDPSLRLRSGGLTNRHRFATGAISSNESLPAASPFLPLRFVSGGLTSRRRFASLRSGRHLRRSHPFLTSPFGRHPLRNPALLKDKFTASFLDSCFDFPDSSFCLVLRRSLSSSSSQLNNTHPHSSAHTRFS